MRTRSRLYVVFALALGLIVGGAVIAIAKPGDPCERSYRADTIKDLKAYETCRFDRIDTQLQELRRSLPGTSPSATGTPASHTTAPSSQPSGSNALSLPRVPWEGGPAYWKSFAKTDKAGWDDPTFFPIGVWWSGVSSDSEVQFDKSLGLNFYTLMNPDTDYNLIERNGMYWVGGSSLRNLKEESPNWVGSFLDDEVDGRFEPPAAGHAEMKQLADAVPPAKTGRFRYANYTSSVLSYDRSPADAQKYVNDFTDTVSIDQYFYSVPQCDWDQNWARYIVEIPKLTCRTSHSYGAMMQALRQRDASDGKLQPLWNFIENMSPYGTTDGFHDIGPAQLKGAVMASVINEARGIIYFNQSFAGRCESGNIFRTAEKQPSGCAAANTTAARQVNSQIRALAPVLNTQSYQWNFGTDLTTMLKAKDGYAYVFAMTTGGTGSRGFNLPVGLTGDVTVVDENRTIKVTNRTFQDTFAAESTYHIYKVKIG